MEIWINPACSKCRSALACSTPKGAEYTVRRYLEDVPTEAEIRAVLDRLGLEPWDITRTQEAVAKELGVREWGREAEDRRAVDRRSRRASRAHPAAHHHRRRRQRGRGPDGRGRPGRPVAASVRTLIRVMFRAPAPARTRVLSLPAGAAGPARFPPSHISHVKRATRTPGNTGFTFEQ